MGANVVEAHGSGQDAEVNGWDAYGEEQATAIAKVEEHGLSLAENIQGGASDNQSAWGEALTA